jgi:hypothetical protein
VGSLAGIFKPFGGEVEKLSAGVAVKDGAGTAQIRSVPTSDRESEAGTILGVIRTEPEVVIVASGAGTLFVIGLATEKEGDSFMTEGFVRRHKVQKVEAAKPRGVDDSGTTPTTLEIRTREPRGNLRRSIHDTGTFAVHTENDSTGIGGGKDGDVATGGKRGSHCEPLSFLR